MAYCRIVSGLAVDVVPSFKDRFHKSLHVQFVQCPNEVQAGWIYDADTDTWSAPPPPPEPDPVVPEEPAV